MDKSRWKLIRTEHILQSLEEALTINRLEQDAVRGFPNTKARQHLVAPVQIVQLVYTPFVGTGNLLCESLASNQGRNYNPEILFDGVVYEEEDEPANITFVATDGEEYHIQPIMLAQNNARVRCTCLDFHYRFTHTDAKADALYGNVPPPYQRRTETRPPANPMGVPGFCKHLFKLVDRLQQDRIVR